LRGIIDRDVHHRRIDRLDDDLAFFMMDGKLRRRSQLAGGNRTIAEKLNPRHRRDLLVGEGGAERLGPVEVLVHHRNDLREGHERFDTRVPGQRLQRGDQIIALQCGVIAVLQPFAGIDHLLRKRCRHE
jgi:hypothetical protein